MPAVRRGLCNACLNYLYAVMLQYKIHYVATEWRVRRQGGSCLLFRKTKNKNNGKCTKQKRTKRKN